MSTRTTFGDLAGAVSGHLARVLSLTASPITRAVYVGEFRRGLRSLAVVMGRCVADVTSAAVMDRPLSSPWARAAIDARMQLRDVIEALAPDAVLPYEFELHRPASPVGDSLHSAAASLAAGRDLLNTHLALEPDGAKAYRSEWAPAVVSVPARTALMLALGRWARLAEAGGRQLSLASDSGSRPPDVAAEEERLQTACESLLTLSRSVAAAHACHPVTSVGLRLLYAIPVNELPPPRVPNGREPCAEMRQGAIESAERVRHLALTTAPDARWAPDLSAGALRETAACATAISHNCAIILSTLGRQAAEYENHAYAEGLRKSAAAAERARDTWLAATAGWKRFALEGNTDVAPLLAETSNLMQWTEQLAYPESDWTLADDTARPIRAPESLAPGPAELREVLAVVHHASEAIAQLAATSHQQIGPAADARRFYVPARFVSGARHYRPFAPAPASRLEPVLKLYRHASRASSGLTTSIAASVTELEAPSAVLISARDAVRGRRTRLASTADAGSRRRVEPAIAIGTPDGPGHFERLLSHLGQNDAEALARAAAIDQAGELLMVETVRTVAPATLAETIGAARRAIDAQDRALASEYEAGL